MSADASLDLGASQMRASESTNLMVAEDSPDHVHFPVRVPHVPIANLLRDCLRELGLPDRLGRFRLRLLRVGAY
jgi:hypothetical protein